jgi:hypothetical protein
MKFDLDGELFHCYTLFQQMLKCSNTMKLTNQQLNDEAEKALRSFLGKIPFLRIEEIRKQSQLTEQGPDFLVKLSLPSGEKTLVGEAKNNGQPRLAKQAVYQLSRYREKYPDAYAIFIAPYISPQAEQVCQQEGVGTLDLAGNCNLCFDQIYIKQEGKPNPFGIRRDLRSLYSPKASRVLRVLLSNPKKSWKVQELATEAGVSLGQVSNTKKLLSDREWIRAEFEGIRLSEPQALLTEWAENYSYRKNKVHDFYSLKSPAEVEAEVAEACRDKRIPYALTSFSGAARLAPSVRYQRTFAYAQDAAEQIEDLARQLSLKSVPSGANVTLLTPYDKGVFYGAREIDGFQVASAIQVYLDLRGFRGRGEEAANTLLEQVIRPAW